MFKAALLLFVYAATMIGLGVVAYTLAPEGANAMTALIIPGATGLLAVVTGIMCLLGKKPAMIGVHAGLVLPLLFAAAFASRAVPLTSSFLDAKAEMAQVRQTVEGGLGAVVEDVQGRLSRGEQVLPDTSMAAKALSKDYLIATFWGLTCVSLLAFVALILLRPKPNAE